MASVARLASQRPRRWRRATRPQGVLVALNALARAARPGPPVGSGGPGPGLVVVGRLRGAGSWDGGGRPRSPVPSPTSVRASPGRSQCRRESARRRGVLLALPAVELRRSHRAIGPRPGRAALRPAAAVPALGQPRRVVLVRAGDPGWVGGHRDSSATRPAGRRGNGPDRLTGSLGAAGPQPGRVPGNPSTARVLALAAIESFLDAIGFRDDPRIISSSAGQSGRLRGSAGPAAFIPGLLLRARGAASLASFASTVAGSTLPVGCLVSWRSAIWALA